MWKWSASCSSTTVDVNSKDEEGLTAFYWASYEGFWDVVIELLTHEGVVDPDVKGAHGNTALIWACLKGQVDVVRTLLECDKVNAHQRNEAGSTAHDIARICNMFEIACCIEEHARRMQAS